MHSGYTIGLDLGTSSVKGVLFEVDTMKIIRKSKCTFIYETDNTGKIEITPDNYIDSCIKVLVELSDGLNKDNLKSMCFASASGNLLFLDNNFSPLSNIINWQDTRTTDETVKVLGKEFNYEAYYKSTGWGFDKKTFPLASLCRIRNNNPDLIDNSAYIGMSTEYLCYYLTDNWGLSTSEGTPFYLIDQVSGCYNTEVLDILGVEINQLPPVIKVGDVIGCISKTISEKTGIPADVPVLCGTFDHPSAARGAAITRPGELLLSCGTSWVGFLPVPSREIAVENHMLIDPFMSENGGCWAGMVSIASVSAVIERYIDEYISDSSDKFEALDSYALMSKKGANGLKINLDKYDDEQYIRSYPKTDIARAIMECLAEKIKECIDGLDLGDIVIDKLVMVGGPSDSVAWPTVISEVLDIKVEGGFGSYTGAYGSAKIAAGICR